jgi:hypothetical protein
LSFQYKKPYLVKSILFILIVLAIVLDPSSLYGQGFAVRTTVGYRVAGGQNTPSGIVMPRESINYMGVLAYDLPNGLTFDVAYLSSPNTSIKFKQNRNARWSQLGDIGVRHLMAGAFYRDTNPYPAVSPFGGVRVGGVSFDSYTAQFESFRRFAIAIEGGVKVPLRPYFGIVTQINMLLPIHFNGDEVFRSTERAYDFSSKRGISGVQFALNTGLYFNFYRN